MTWIDDHCTDARAVLSERRARGILALHESCEPPCPRKRAAAAYLEILIRAGVLT